MQVTTVNFLPPVDPGAGAPQGSTTPVFSIPYFIAQFNGTAMDFDTKLILTHGGKTVQMMTKDAQGQFTVASSGNAFSIDNSFLGIELLPSIVVNGTTRFSVRLFKDTNTQNQLVPGTSSNVVLFDVVNNNPYIGLEEVRHVRNGATFTRVDFLGALDTILGYSHAALMIEPGQTVYLKCNTANNLIFQF